MALADLPEPAPASCRGCEVDFAGVLDRQHMAAFCRRHRAFAPAFDHACGRHLGIAEKAVEPHFLGAVAFSQSPQADIIARNHAFDERRPPLSRRRSPNRPSDQSVCASMSTPLPKLKCRNRNHTNSRFWNPLARPKSIRRTRCLHALVRKQGPITTAASDLEKPLPPPSISAATAWVPAFAGTTAVDSGALAPRLTSADRSARWTAR